MTNQIQKKSEESYLKITSTDLAKAVVEEMPEHKEMIELINKNLPEIKRASSLFGKHQSHFMDDMLTVAHYTPLRNMRQILAQITKLREGIQDNNIRLRKKELKLKIKKEKLLSTVDENKKALIEIEIDELTDQLENAKLYLSGAIRSMSNYTQQYNSIAKQHNIVEFNEEQFEAEEEKYHIMKAFEQGYCAAVTRGGTFDEGNMIYVTQLGINGHVAQKEMVEYLQLEDSLLKEGKEPTHKMFQMFLERMAEKFSGCSKNFAERKGMGNYTRMSSLKEGDKSLFDKELEAEDLDVMKKLYALAENNDNEFESKAAVRKLGQLLINNGMTLADLEKLL